MFERRKNRRVRPWNPLADDQRALNQASYHRPLDAEFMSVLPEFGPAGAEINDIHTRLRDMILGEGYPCVGSRSALNKDMYRIGLYGELGSSANAYGLCHDLYEFSREFTAYGNHSVTLIACFRTPEILSEIHFEELLWEQIRCLHDVDRHFFAWDPTVSSDPSHGNFSFSIGGRGFFVVGLHPHASRRARRFGSPVLVFNLHEQFDRLRERGKFETMKKLIRARDTHYAGSINPVLADYGTSSEARQYSGRAVSADWKCPFHVVDKGKP
ncbi:MAG: guanitoxin biosynthesis heme-dependent pre-guanitoxin N-hydroxylase GntA [Gammaproteobacteria bacterium]